MGQCRALWHFYRRSKGRATLAFKEVYMSRMEPGHAQITPSPGGRKLGLVLAWTISGAGVGIVLVTFPFLVPALRRFCLPYVPATDMQIRHVLSQLGGRTGKVVDLGSGDGRVVIAAAVQGHQAVGYELNPWLVLYSRWKAYRSGVYRSTKFYCKNLWKVQLYGYNNIIFFGVEQMMEPLAAKIVKEAPLGSRVIACRYQFPGWTPAVKFDMGPNSVFVYDQLPRETVLVSQ